MRHACSVLPALDTRILSPSGLIPARRQRAKVSRPWHALSLFRLTDNDRRKRWQPLPVAAVEYLAQHPADIATLFAIVDTGMAMNVGVGDYMPCGDDVVDQVIIHGLGIG